MPKFLKCIGLFLAFTYCYAQIHNEEKSKWLETEISQDYRTKLKTSDIQTIVLKNGKTIEAEKGILTIKISKYAKLKWLEVGKPGEGLLDKDDFKLMESMKISSSTSTVVITLHNGTTKKLSHVKFFQDVPKKSEKRAIEAEIEVFWADFATKKVRRDRYSFWNLREIQGKSLTSSQKNKKVNLEIKEPKKKEVKTPDRSWMENERSKIFASKISTSDIVKMKLRKDGKWIEAIRNYLGIKVVKGFKIVGKDKKTREKKTKTKAGFLSLRAVEDINELKRSLTLVTMTGKKTYLTNVKISNPKIEYYQVDDRIKQVRRGFVRFWKLKEIEVNKPKPKKKKTSKKKSSKKNQKSEAEKEQEKLAKKTQKSHFHTIILTSGKTYQAEAGSLAIFLNSDFEVAGLENEKEKTRSDTSIRGLQKIEEIDEATKSFITVTAKGTRKKMTQIQITEPDVEIIHKEGKNYSSFTISFWKIKEIQVKPPQEGEGEKKEENEEKE